MCGPVDDLPVGSLALDLTQVEGGAHAGEGGARPRQERALVGQVGSDPIHLHDVGKGLRVTLCAMLCAADMWQSQMRVDVELVA